MLIFRCNNCYIPELFVSSCDCETILSDLRLPKAITLCSKRELGTRIENEHVFDVLIL